MSLSALLLPFLGIGVALVGCRFIDRVSMRRWPRSKRIFVGFLVLVGIAIAYGLYNYNRGAFVMPVVAMLATYSLRGSRIRAPAVMGAALLGLIVVIAVGGFRTNYFLAQGGGSSPQASSPSLTDTLQVYGQGPQFLGFMLDATSNQPPALGATLIASALSPLPILGKTYRTSSGTALYNGLIYGPNGPSDQIIPLAGELYLNFGIPGVVGGFMLLGAAVAMLGQAARRSPDTLGTYAAYYAAFWVAFTVLVSVSVLSQIFIFFMLPLIVILGVGRLSAGQPRSMSA